MFLCLPLCPPLSFSSSLCFTIFSFTFYSSLSLSTHLSSPISSFIHLTFLLPSPIISSPLLSLLLSHFHLPILLLFHSIYPYTSSPSLLPSCYSLYSSFTNLSLFFSSSFSVLIPISSTCSLYIHFASSSLLLSPSLFLTLHLSRYTTSRA